MYTSKLQSVVAYDSESNTTTNDTAFQKDVLELIEFYKESESDIKEHFVTIIKALSKLGTRINADFPHDENIDQQLIDSKLIQLKASLVDKSDDSSEEDNDSNDATD